MHSAPGTGRLVAGRYRLLDQLGRGAMGIVWRGRDELLDRDVAIKQIVLGPMASATEAHASYQRTLREARTAARLSHPGVVTVFDVVEEEGSPWIVMELVRARPLDQVIAEDGPLPPARAAQLGLGLLDALSSAHQAGVLHRDVKPSNVLISPDGKAVLTDFGIATIQGDPGLTQAGMVVGTPGFSPPERVRGKPATPASDLWSLGATLYAAVEGRGPFDRAGGSAAIVASIATEPAPRAPSAGSLAPVIDALLRPNPADRPDAVATARMLRQAWREARTPDRAGLAMSRAAAPSAAAPGQPATEATTATQIVTVPPDRGSIGSKLPIVAVEPELSGGPAVGPPEVAAASAAAASATGVVPDLMATPNFADLRMPAGPADGLANTDPLGLTEPLTPSGPLEAASLLTADPLPAGPVSAVAVKPAPRSADQAGSPSGSASPTAPNGTPQAPATSGAGRSTTRGGGTGEFFRSRRGLGITAPIAALIIVAVIVLVILPGVGHPIIGLGGGSGIGQGAVGDHLHGKSAKPGQSNSAGHHQRSHPGKSGGSTAPAPGKSSPGKSAPGKHHPSGKPSPTGKANPSGKPSSSGKPSVSASPSTSTSPSTSPSASPSPTPTQTKTAPEPPPAGYQWFRVTAASVGTIAGFRVAGPAGWVLSPGLYTTIKPTSGAGRLAVDLSQWAVPGAVKEARKLQAAAIANGNYPHYRLILLNGARFHGWPAARWIFRWRPPGSVHPAQVIDLLFTAQTYEGPQEYILTVSAPLPKASLANDIFTVAKQTFRALPAP